MAIFISSFIFFTIFLRLKTAHARENSPPAFPYPLKLNRLKPPVFIWPNTGSTITLRLPYIYLEDLLFIFSSMVARIIPPSSIYNIALLPFEAVHLLLKLHPPHIPHPLYILFLPID